MKSELAAANRPGLVRGRTIARWVLICLYFAAGIFHLSTPDTFLMITPDWVPFPRQVILITGVCELCGAIGLMTGRFRYAAGICLALYAVCVFPANIKHAIYGLPPGHTQLGWWYHGPRLLMQPVIVWWALFAGGVTLWPFAGKRNKAGLTGSTLPLLCLILAATLFPSVAHAELKPGDKAPDFTADASLGGQTFRFDLAEALKQGPVVMYFYPAAFTSGCTLEAHDFAEAIDRYKALGATVIGVSEDSIETLTRFSVSECRSKFAVAADSDGTIMKSYDAVMSSLFALADRTSYVITPDDRILYSFSASDPTEHVANTLQALRAWRAGHPDTAGK